MKAYQCPSCNHRVFFENVSCVVCGSELGYIAAEDHMVVLTTAPAPEAQAPVTGWQACANRQSIACNWLVPMASQPTSAQPTLCDCCRYTSTVPKLDDVTNQQAWYRLEQAKRYLFYSLYALKLPIPDRVQQPDSGLSFEFLAELPQQQKVMTGHADGVITINIAEADDVRREQHRISLHEPYRTLLGHLRHEIGHFYWQQLLAPNGEQLEKFRQLFGDERSDYAIALQRHYQSHDDGSWRANYISRYASSHPWEDWAETWAHYLHIGDALDTAAHWQVGIDVATANIKPTRLAKTATDLEFKDMLIAQWLPLSLYLNAACRSLGEPDAYPFILSAPVIDKLVFIHTVIRAA